MKNKLLFSLDIGTRSVIGIVAEQADDKLKIIATERKEHNTRAMLDGQIHDVPEVAAILRDVKNMLEKKTGTLQHAAVAAAGRALYTVTADAELEISDLLTDDDERTLDFSAIQNAQKKLANSNMVEDPTLYYCVGYSTVKYTLDGTQLKTLVGQRGKRASSTVIATFLPRQVIDSMQSALNAAGLEMSALTLEPIAAINVLIPPTMRHLNLVLVDIGAGTSDVAVTKNGSVVGYGMVPLAGDEITEAISQQYLLDFNVAETVKRQISSVAKQRKIFFKDILGMEYRLLPKEIVDAVLPNITELAKSIAAQILSLNATAPQAVLLVGGGSLTPSLPELIAQALSIPAQRVAVRVPDTINGIDALPNNLKTPDSVTPLGILKAAATQTLNFITVNVNNTAIRLFNLGKLSVSNALLAAGISLKTLGGKPGLGITITVNNERKFIAGSMGKMAQLSLNGNPAVLTAPIKNGDSILTASGTDGKEPSIYLKDILPTLPSYDVLINDTKHTVQAAVTLNNAPGTPEQKLSDRDTVTWREVKNLGEILRNAGYTPTPRKFRYRLNGDAAQYSASPRLLLNGAPATLSTLVKPEDAITFIEPKSPLLEEIIGISNLQKNLTLYFNKKPCQIPAAQYEISLNGKPADLETQLQEEDQISYTVLEKSMMMVSDVLLAAEYQPPNAHSHVKFQILVNQKPAEFTTPIKNGDAVDVVITPLER